MKKVAVIMGSDSDWPVVKGACQQLETFGIPYEAHILSAHRTPAAAADFARSARANGFGVLICAAGVVLEPLLAQLPDLSLNVGRGLWTLLMLVLFAPVLEELICRGLVLGTLRARYGVTLAWLVSALFFGVMHLQPVQVINAFVVGLILGYVYISTDSLWSVMILHAMNNAVAYLMMITGHANTLLIDLIHNRVVYVAVYVVAVALLIVSGRMMLLALRRIKEAEKNRAAA